MRLVNFRVSNPSDESYRDKLPGEGPGRFLGFKEAEDAGIDDGLDARTANGRAAGAGRLPDTGIAAIVKIDTVAETGECGRCSWSFRSSSLVLSRCRENGGAGWKQRARSKRVMKVAASCGFAGCCRWRDYRSIAKGRICCVESS